MSSYKITKNGENALKMQFEGLIPLVHMFHGPRNPNLRSILKPELELMVFLRMRSNKIKQMAENALKMQFEGLISHVYIFFLARGIRI